MKHHVAVFTTLGVLLSGDAFASATLGTLPLTEMPTLLAQGAADTSIEGFAEKIGKFVTYVLSPIGVVIGVFMIWSAAKQGKQGDPEAWAGVLWGGIVAAAAVIVFMVMKVFGGKTEGVDAMGIF